VPVTLPTVMARGGILAAGRSRRDRANLRLA